MTEPTAGALIQRARRERYKAAGLCTICGKRPREGLGTCQRCADRHGSYQKAALKTEEGRARNRAYKRKHRYGVEDADRNCGLCYICNRWTTRIGLDHCHETGAVRGWLCFPCNAGLGQFSDDVARLRSAISYLEKYACKS